MPVFKDPIAEAVRDFLEPKFKVGLKLQIAFSGGPDSLALLIAVAEWAQIQTKVDIEAHHIRHGLRTSDEKDAAFAQSIAEQWGIDFYLDQLTPPKYKVKGGIQDWARKARYEALIQRAEHRGAQAILTAHHGDDLHETFLMRWIRGTGLEGLASIPSHAHWPHSKVQIWRPLLGVHRSDILTYLEKRDLEYWQDPTNLKDSYLRNRIRHHLMPMVQALGSVQAMDRTLQNLRKDSLALKALTQWLIDHYALITSEPAFYLSLEIVRNLGEGACAQLARHMARYILPGFIPSHLAVREWWKILNDVDRKPWNDGQLIYGREGHFGVIRNVQSTDPPVMQSLEFSLHNGIHKVNDFVFASWLHHSTSLSFKKFEALKRSLNAWHVALDLDDIHGPLYWSSVIHPNKVQVKQWKKKIEQNLRHLGIPKKLYGLYPGLWDGKGLIWIPGALRMPRAWIHKNSPKILEIQWMKSPSWFFPKNKAFQKG